MFFFKLLKQKLHHDSPNNLQAVAVADCGIKNFRFHVLRFAFTFYLYVPRKIKILKTFYPNMKIAIFFSLGLGGSGVKQGK